MKTTPAVFLTELKNTLNVKKNAITPYYTFMRIRITMTKQNVQDSVVM
jgi:hypothetical protein